jgi:hypothetical protein
MVTGVTVVRVVIARRSTKGRRVRRIMEDFAGS